MINTSDENDESDHENSSQQNRAMQYINGPINSQDKIIFMFVARVLYKTLHKTRVKLEHKTQNNEIMQSELKSAETRNIVDTLQQNKKINKLKIENKELSTKLREKERKIEDLERKNSDISEEFKKIARKLTEAKEIEEKQRNESKEFQRREAMKSVIKEASMRANIKSLQKSINKVKRRMEEPYMPEKDLPQKDGSKPDINLRQKSSPVNFNSVPAEPDEKLIPVETIPQTPSNRRSSIMMKRAVSRRQSDLIVNTEKGSSKKGSKIKISNSQFFEEEKKDPFFKKNKMGMKLILPAKSNTRSESAKFILSNTSDDDLNLFEALLISHDRVFELLKTCKVEDISENLMFIVYSIQKTPLWLNNEREKATSILQYRTKNSKFLQQNIQYALNSGLLDSNDFHVQLNPDSNPIYDSFFSKKRKKDYEILIDEKKSVIHPFEPATINRMIVKRVINSNTRPLLVKLYPRDNTTKLNKKIVIVKNGDDLRRDMAVMQIFKLMNTLWKSEKSVNKFGAIEAVTYRVAAVTNTTGVIEYVTNTFPIQELKRHQKKFGGKEIRRQINTAAGGTIASFLLGIKDRHDDNTLFSDSGEIFQIDFSYMLGQKVTLDTAEISITRDTKRHFGDKGWKKFIDACIRAFCTIRNNYEIVIEFCKIILSPLYPEFTVKRYLRQTLMLNLPYETAVKNLRSMLKKAPSSYRTRLKNVLHHTALAFSKKDDSELFLSDKSGEEDGVVNI